MTITFEKAPLKEIIAELRWGVGSVPLELIPNQPLALPASFFADAAHEKLFIALSDELSKIGYGRSERLTPAGFPALPNQPMYRYQSNSQSSSKSVVFQAGLGVFSVHAVPPYKSWEEFLPTVKSGLEALLKSYSAAVEQQPISLVTLRYVDFFEEELVQGRDIATFMSEVLSVSVRLPDFITAIAKAKKADNVYVKFSLPVAAGTLNVCIGDGKLNNLPGILLDTAIATSGAVPPTLDKIIEVLDSSYSILHNMFLELTKPIHHLMQPKER